MRSDQLRHRYSDFGFPSLPRCGLSPAVLPSPSRNLPIELGGESRGSIQVAELHGRLVIRNPIDARTSLCSRRELPPISSNLKPVRWPSCCSRAKELGKASVPSKQNFRPRVPQEADPAHHEGAGGDMYQTSKWSWMLIRAQDLSYIAAGSRMAASKCPSNLGL